MTVATAELLEAIAACACDVTGFSRDAIEPRALQRVLAGAMRDGLLAADILEAARRRSDVLVARVVESVAVCETYFFRNAEQLETLVERAVEGASARAQASVAVWSAGCASGEEAWSLASLLRRRLPPGWTYEVLGTDLLPGNVATARAGVYGSWSVRRAGQGPEGTYRALSDGRVQVDDALRPAVRFEVGNLLDGRVQGTFDVVACRNVLVYFADATRLRALDGLAAAVRPGGLLALGAMDVEGVPAGFEREGPAEWQLYRRVGNDAAAPPPPERPKPDTRVVPRSPATALPRRAPPPAPRPAPSPTPARTDVPELPPVMRHLEALLMLERGDAQDARRVLRELAASAPDYIPVHLELALLLGRDADDVAAFEAARTARALALRLPADAVVDGPEPLAASFYAEAASRLLAREGGAP